MYRFFAVISCALFVGLRGVNAFSDEAIFEDEDIYNQALPPINRTGLTVPGTKWCGPGNTANGFDDLGSNRDTDKCCRQHDHCPDIMEPQTSAHGLNNPDWFPILHCKCEQEFINCLQTVNNMVSNMMGRIYYGFRSKCFSNGYPILSCKEYHSSGKRCIRYKVDNTKPKLWQFYDMPYYSVNRASSLNGYAINRK